MSRISRETNRALKEAERDLETSLSWPVSPTDGSGGSVYACVPSQSIFGKMLAASGGGFSPKGTAGFYVRTELFNGPPGAPAALPASQDYVSFGSLIWRILNVDTSSDGAYLFLDCAVKDQGA